MKKSNRPFMKHLTALSITAFALLVITLAFHPEKASAKGFTKVKMIRVVDGDTIIVQKNGKQIRVRMIGINTPESVAPSGYKANTEEGRIASTYTKKLFSKKKYVWLEYDKDKYDKYGRTLAYVWMTKKPKKITFKVFKKKNAGALIMQHTYCEAVYYAPNRKYRAWYERLEKEKNAKTKK